MRELVSPTPSNGDPMAESNQKHTDMPNDTDTPKSCEPPSSRSPSTTCSRSFDDLMESLDAWIEDSLKGSKPVGLTLSRARSTITDQRERIGEIFDALECQNKEVEKLRAAIRNLRDVEGRHHSEIATKRLFALLPENA